MPPRVDYPRTYHALHHSVTPAQAATLFKIAWKLNRATVGGSFDDAGIGDLSEKHAKLHGVPDDQKQAYNDFFDDFYPDTQYKHMPWLPPGPFIATHWPTDHIYVTQEFGDNYEYYFKNFGLPGHEGIDLRAPKGTPLYALADGEVFYVDYTKNYGNQVRIRHNNGYRSIYAHMVSTRVTPGTQLRGGQLIGFAGNSGNSSGAHLHLTLKRDGYTYTDDRGITWPYNIVDPTPYLFYFLNHPTKE